jgi:7-cyano-7-deazaguanine synthase
MSIEILNIKSLVILSGGQDSTTCLYWALQKFGANAVEAITFDYGQRHRAELDCAINIAEFAHVSHTVIPIDTFTALGGNALVDEDIPVQNNLVVDTELPNTFVPGRNIIFLTFAAAYAWEHNIEHLVTGVAQADYSNYPDCRQKTIEALQLAIRLGMESNVVIHTPLMNLSKKQIVLLARDLGALDVMGLTHTCYKGRRPPCGECAACELRAKGFDQAGIQDPLLSGLA